MTSEKKKEQKRIQSACDSCIHFVYDEGYLDYACEVALDEDEMLAYGYGTRRDCPYYQYKDEYINVRKQI
ncbi:MAG: hypothetical protein IJV96_04795 [Clostridia bacterium]|nr:hypothetical protein [Clostridia bacterium]